MRLRKEKEENISQGKNKCEEKSFGKETTDKEVQEKIIDDSGLYNLDQEVCKETKERQSQDQNGWPWMWMKF